MNDKANAFVVIVGLVSMATVAFVYVALSEAVDDVLDIAKAEPWYAGEAKDTIDFLEFIWNLWPIAAVIVIGIWMLAASIRRREESFVLR
jgi:nitrate reductase NapE component